jgi:archaellin
VGQGPVSVFKLSGSGSLQGSDAADALVAAINQPYIDDTCTKLQFQIVSSSTIGIYRNGVFYLLNSNTGGNADTTFGYGNTAGDIPVIGDWNGDGIDTVGVYRNGVFYLRNTNSNGFAGIAFSYGNLAGEIPIIGDWNGDGIDTVGVYRNGVFYLRNTNSNGFADVVFGYGNIAGDIPVVGDWNSDGIDTVGVYRNGVFYLKNSNTYGIADLAFTYGQPGDIPAIGDWNGDGVDTVGIYRYGAFYLKNSNTNGIADMAFAYGQPGDKPSTGAWLQSPMTSNIQMIGNVYGLASNPSQGIDEIRFTIGLAPGSSAMDLTTMNIIFSTPSTNPIILSQGATTSTSVFTTKLNGVTPVTTLNLNDQVEIAFNVTPVPVSTKVKIEIRPPVGAALPFSKTTPPTISTVNVLY